MERLKSREEVRECDKWKITDLYANDDIWDEDYKMLKAMTEEFRSFEGKLSESGKMLYEAWNKCDAMNLLLEKLFVYANQRLHENSDNGFYQAMAGKAQNIMVLVTQVQAFMEPEFLEISDEDFQRLMEQEERLGFYRLHFNRLRDKKEHILSKDQEAIMAGIGQLTQAPGDIFAMFNNADIKFADITGEDGGPAQVTHGNYTSFMQSKDRRVRKEAFESMYGSYEAYSNTLAAVFAANVRQDVFISSTRHYKSCMETALSENRIPVQVYENLINTVHEHMEPMYEYMDVKKKLLGVDKLHMYDIYVPIIDTPDINISFEQAKEMVKDALAPLGEDYIHQIQNGFDNGWIDVYENQGKRSGAYSWGAYGTHPYVLLNYQNNLNSVFTLAHEMGHAMHSWYSDNNQDYHYAGYKIFVAEVASTCNESLLIHHLLERTQDKKEKKYLLNYFLEQFRTTLYRQVMFAEFEYQVHSYAEKGNAITKEYLCKLYHDLNVLYYGKNVEIDSQIDMEWSRIPHFYTPFYVYQYATGFSAAMAISEKIHGKEKGIIEQYKKFLQGGASMDCIDLLKLCNVDMTCSEPINKALTVFEQNVKALKGEM